MGDATRILDDYHKHSVAEANKSRDIENDVIGALTGLRSDLGQKIKEIKSLSGDFKNSVEKEKEGTKREVEKLQEALQHVDHEDGSPRLGRMTRSLSSLVWTRWSSAKWMRRITCTG